MRIDFDEPLDNAMLRHVFAILNSRGEPVGGGFQIAEQEKRLLFLPKAAWRAGTYSISVETTLEDLAGNSIERPFEVDVFNSVEVPTERSTATIPFSVR